MRYATYILNMVVVGCWIPTTCFGQISPGAPASSSLQYFYQAWKVKDSEASQLSQSVVPVGIFLPMADGIETHLSTSFVKMTNADTNTQLSGFTDIKIKTNWALLPRRNLVWGIALNLPSGKHDLTQAEAELLTAFISPDISVRQYRLGEGLNVGSTLSYAQTLSRNILLGGAIGYVNRGAFETYPLIGENQIELKPGNEVNFFTALDYVGTKWQLRFSPSFTVYSTEYQDAVPVFKLGNKIQGQLVATRKFNKGNFTIAIQNAYRQRNKLKLTDTAPLQTPEHITATNYFAYYSGLNYRVSSASTVSLSGGARFVGPKIDDETINPYGYSDIYEGGISLTTSPSKFLTLSLGGRFSSSAGKGWSTRQRSVKGFETFARLTYQFD